jgi:hypothetical protein
MRGLGIGLGLWLARKAGVGAPAGFAFLTIGGQTLTIIAVPVYVRIP